ncbi:hypothetical protein F4604DRAFT_1688674 [Suillus subluteus]|nr:hypothetical protein F4604DRAFT_1688674 [Suillus subluteus]
MSRGMWTSAPIIQGCCTGKECRITSSHMRFLTKSLSIPIPQMPNQGNYIVLLSRFIAWLGNIAEEMEIYQDLPWARWRGGGLCIWEGAHHSIAKELIQNFDLRQNSDLQTYGIGLKKFDTWIQSNINLVKSFIPWAGPLTSGHMTLYFPGGALVGCSAGFVSIANIKGAYNAMKNDMSQYKIALKNSWVWSDFNEGSSKVDGCTAYSTHVSIPPYQLPSPASPVVNEFADFVEFGTGTDYKGNPRPNLYIRRLLLYLSRRSLSTPYDLRRGTTLTRTNLAED